MSDHLTEVPAEDGPSYDLGQVNVTSLQELLTFLGNNYPFVDEAAKNAFNSQVASLNTSGDPHAEKPTPVDTAEVDAANAKIAELEAQLAEARSQAQTPPAGTI